MQRWDIINFFIEKYKFKKYLEIGYYKGWSFDQVKCDMKTAVDPEPCKTPQQEMTKFGSVIEDPEGMIFKMKSDDFFFSKGVTDARLRLAHERNGLSYEPAKYDIIFIDGLHAWHQVSKDIENALNNLSDGGVIVLHDCNPPQYEHTTSGIDGCWTGDTYKAAIDFRVEHPGVMFYTVNTDWGVGVIKTNQKANKHYDWMGDEKEWNVFDKGREKILNLVDMTTFLSLERTYKAVPIKPTDHVK